MKKNESLVTMDHFNQGLAKLEGGLGERIGEVEKRLDKKIDGVEKRLNKKIVQLEVKIDGKFEKFRLEVDNKAQQYRNQILDRLDEVMVEIKASREERVAVSARVSDHETRLVKLEEKESPENVV